MKLLVIGSGGREHALVWKLAQSPRVEKIYCAPGNAGIARQAQLVSIRAEDLDSLAQFAKKGKIDLTVVGPEIPLVNGIVNVFQKQGLPIFGPPREAAFLEGSKAGAKKFMTRYGIRTARYDIFTKVDGALEFLRRSHYPIVVKADGLAAGKGVVVAKNEEEATHTVLAMMKEKVFGAAGEQVVIEECLAGEEISVLALVDGKTSVILESSQDHKRIYDGDLGPNTGGMGAFSPSPRWDDALAQKARKEIFEPVLAGLKREGLEYRGLLYAGLMLDASLKPYVLEFNVRFGDPETQAVLPRLESDLLEAMLATVEQKLSTLTLCWKKEKSVCVVMASGGYPGKYTQGYEIQGLSQAAQIPNTAVFHAGTVLKEGKTLTAGGRVLGVTGLGADFRQAQQQAYAAVEKISFQNAYYRRDIGKKALEGGHYAQATSRHPNGK